MTVVIRNQVAKKKRKQKQKQWVVDQEKEEGREGGAVPDGFNVHGAMDTHNGIEVLIGICCS